MCGTARPHWLPRILLTGFKMLTLPTDDQPTGLDIPVPHKYAVMVSMLNSVVSLSDVDDSCESHECTAWFCFSGM